MTAKTHTATKAASFYEMTRSVPDKKALSIEACSAPSLQAQIEDEIFYPAVKSALNDKLLVPKATFERGGVEDLMAELEGAEHNGESYDAKVTVLSKYVKHHVKEAQNKIFPKFKALLLERVKLGTRLAACKDDLLAQAA